MPSISGTSQQGRTVGCLHGRWRGGPTSFTYRWRRGGRTVSRARKYQLVNADVGKAISCTVVARNANGNGDPALSAPIVPVPSVPDNKVRPKVSGSPEVYRQLTCTRGSWSPVPSAFAYKWVRNGSPLPGVTTRTYNVARADLGQRLRCRVFASNPGGWRFATSRAVVPHDSATPVVGSFGVSPSEFTVGPKPTAGAKRAVGAVFQYALSEPAKVAVKIERQRTGYLKQGECLKLTGDLRREIHRKVSGR